MFLGLRPRRAVLSDLNAALVESFRRVRENPALVSKYLKLHARHHDTDHYYQVREKYNLATRYSFAQAARFIYLNRTCFNGIFRVNRAGEFNVPCGNIADPQFPSKVHLEGVAAALSRAQLLTCDYQEAMAGAQENDFLYLDPPYPPLNGTSFFRHYTPERFDESDQFSLARAVADASDRGCLVMISNADTPLIRSLYRDFNKVTIPVTRSVSSKNRKHAVRELIITNYEIPDRQMGLQDA